jgi:predicted membrane protein DUF2306
MVLTHTDRDNLAGLCVCGATGPWLFATAAAVPAGRNSRHCLIPDVSGSARRLPLGYNPAHSLAAVLTTSVLRPPAARTPSPPARAPGAGAALYAVRLVFGSAMVGAIIVGFAAIRRRDVQGHRAWIMRGYAIGLGAGTQVLTGLAGALIGGPPSELRVALLMAAGWIINLGVAEWVIRRPPHPGRVAGAGRPTGVQTAPVPPG